MVNPAKGSVVIVMILWIFGTADFFLRLPVMSSSTHFIIQQFLPQVGSEMQRPGM
jgi:hypothetical protein